MLNDKTDFANHSRVVSNVIVTSLPSSVFAAFCALRFLTCLACASDYSNRSVDGLINDLTQIDAQSPGINSSAIYEGFIAVNSGSFRGGVLGVARPKVPPQMAELVRRGPVVLPELVKHLNDIRPTKLEVGNKASGKQVGVDAFMFMYFSDEYDPRVPYRFSEQDWKSRPQSMERSFEGRYTVKVGDICYVLIGQIVNRRLLSVRYQPSAGLVVNSPIEAPVLVEKVQKDWGRADAEILKASLLDDIHASNHPKWITREQYTDRVVNPALERLRFYFPEAFKSLKGSDLQKRRRFERNEKQQPGSAVR